MRYLHTMVRIRRLDESINFYCVILGLKEVRRYESEKGRFTLIFLAAPDDFTHVQAGLASGRRDAPCLELTYNWDDEAYTGGRNFGHLAYEVDNIYDYCASLEKAGVVINRPPRDGNMAFVKSPDGVSIEILQKGKPLAPSDYWSAKENSGSW